MLADSEEGSSFCSLLPQTRRKLQAISISTTANETMDHRCVAAASLCSTVIKTDISLEIAHTKRILKDKLSAKRDQRFIFIHFLPLIQGCLSALHQQEELADDAFNPPCVSHLQTYISTSKERRNAAAGRRFRRGTEVGTSLLFNLWSLIHAGVLKEEDLSNGEGPREGFQPFQKTNEHL